MRTAHPIVLYDGVCGMCNRMVRFVLRRDREGVFRFAALQSPLAERVLAGQGLRASELDTFYVVDGEEVLARSEAVMFVLRRLGGMWGVGAGVFRLLPRGMRDRMYGVVARNRYRVFGKYEVCPSPSKEERERFLTTLEDFGVIARLKEQDEV
jgi:predicted DCC family thiol-disulfide oxidoreductase YuxK